ncbi:hypothetical protein ES332_A05G125400v1 [Gossypium tomentosum]|uniref:Uncharacterized protein n=1 Tax=Gossypium tomentosum TaxID=34277 RepID=A0A5D2QHE7_GOSTO|nr:hypothetical protein ES332_A05G125400v1 [Gossypium tomentosum]TYI26620.1 hypothetical protein ES332_A05G125400v1 [Gossypium tomentosum]TYI26622.1 hypothetical protein ES332_A05G125400v1 [Gossypium tomentosum]TYI26624.1 hypothetical protein ES332_A05G125400v1 [Gossypium tomentosum]TYI26627.1 hypothetical protein ES332_A05G125400v1 [Gossypium tomentosum]
MFDSSLVQSALSQNEGQLDVVSELQDNNSSIEETSYNEETGSVESCSKSSDFYPYRFQLEQDAQELLSHIAVLEGTISKLEQEMISLHFQLSQERNERRLAEYRLRHSVSPSMSPSSRCLQHSDSVLHHSSDDNSCQERTDHPSESTGDSSSLDLKNAMDMILHHDGKKISAKTDGKSLQPLRFEEISRGITPKGLWDHPNRLSEEMVRCMRNIFISLADSAVPSKSSVSNSHSSTLSPRGHLSNSSWWTSSERSMIPSWVQSPQVDIQSNSEVLASENSFDPYRVRGKLSWAEIGNYGLSTEVSWMSVGKQQLEYASGALRKFRTLVEQLAKVNPIHLSCNEKLAFWINLYNALIMHAYLAYGVPRSDLKLFSLMQKAAYTVGGYSFSAAAIEYVILKMKPPLHRPQIALLLALHKLKVSDEQRKSAIDTYEPLVTFALSSGMYSSPAVRIYTAKNVREELEEAQRDFIRASVGVSSKGKLLVPKLLHCFAKGFVDDSNLAVWISHYLPPNQAAFVEQCISQRRQSLLGSRNCGILPFDSRFRYLFLPDKNISIQ